MDILGIGPTEFLFIIIILLLVVGPTDLISLGQRTGKMIRKIRTSETWLMVSGLARALRNLPNTLADEAGTDEILREVMPDRYRKPAGNISMQNAKDVTPDARTVQPPEAQAYEAWTTPAPPGPAAPAEPDAEGPASPAEELPPETP